MSLNNDERPRLLQLNHANGGTRASDVAGLWLYSGQWPQNLLGTGWQTLCHSQVCYRKGMMFGVPAISIALFEKSSEKMVEGCLVMPKLQLPCHPVTKMGTCSKSNKLGEPGMKTLPHHGDSLLWVTADHSELLCAGAGQSHIHVRQKAAGGGRCGETHRLNNSQHLLRPDDRPGALLVLPGHRPASVSELHREVVTICR